VIQVSLRSVPVRQVMSSGVYSERCAALPTSGSASMGYSAHRWKQQSNHCRKGPGSLSTGLSARRLGRRCPMAARCRSSAMDHPGVFESLQRVLTNGAPGEWGTTPEGIDGNFGPHTKASVEAFQAWGGVSVDGVVGDQTWSVSLHAAGATLESAVGLDFVVD
jgi:murein L,D-transpeptidase YcbB/YkuD